MPWYDERFKGYRKNKVVHLMHLQHLGLNFVATPRAWVVHSPHPTANSWTVTKSTGFWYKVRGAAAAGAGAAATVAAAAAAAALSLAPLPLLDAYQTHSIAARGPAAGRPAASGGAWEKLYTGAANSHPPPPPPPVPSAPTVRLQLKRLYNEARSQMEASAFVPVTAFRCESKRAERWSWYRRLLL